MLDGLRADIAGSCAVLGEMKSWTRSTRLLSRLTALSRVDSVGLGGRSFAGSWHERRRMERDVLALLVCEWNL